jgi:drug/metabolite transporter (DMT)-like permease
MMDNKQQSKTKTGYFLLLQLSVFVYSFSMVAARKASENDFLSGRYIFFLGLEIVILGIYAVLWQQVIKRFQLSVAYINKSVTLLWSMLWNYLIFSQGITVKKVIGVLIVMAGVIVMNLGEGKDE